MRLVILSSRKFNGYFFKMRPWVLVHKSSLRSLHFSAKAAGVLAFCNWSAVDRQDAHLGKESKWDRSFVKDRIMHSYTQQIKHILEQSSPSVASPQPAKNSWSPQVFWTARRNKKWSPRSEPATVSQSHHRLQKPLSFAAVKKQCLVIFPAIHFHVYVIKSCFTPNPCHTQN